MNTIQINPDGMITISAETVEERAAMAKHYASMETTQTLERDSFSPRDTGEGEAYDAGFQGGWSAAVRETQLRFVNGQLLDFYNEQETPSYSMDQVSMVDLEQAAEEHADKYGDQDPHYKEPEGTGEDFSNYEQDHGRETTEANPDFEDNWAKASEMFDDENPKFEPVSTVDPHGEPDTKEDHDYVESGTWTLSNEELNSRINEAHRRGHQEGVEEGMAARGISVTRRTLEIKARELIARDTLANFASGGPSPTRLDILFGESMEAFVLPFAQSLGFKVVD